MANFVVSSNIRKKGKSYNIDIPEKRIEATSLHAAAGKAAREIHKEMKGVRIEKLTLIITRI